MRKRLERSRFRLCQFQRALFLQYRVCRLNACLSGGSRERLLV
jgi:hypothetical protein